MQFTSYILAQNNVSIMLHYKSWFRTDSLSNPNHYFMVKQLQALAYQALMGPQAAKPKKEQQ